MTWFHCRRNSFDTSNDVLLHAIHLLSHELVCCHRIYVRAIVHYIQSTLQTFVLRSLKQLNYQVDSRNYSDNLSNNKKPISFLVVNERNTEVSSAYKIAYKCKALEFNQYLAFIEDYDKVRFMVDDWRHSPSLTKYLSKVDVDGICYAATDFISALIELNRLLHRKHIKDEDRRKLLFGFDQILS